MLAIIYWILLILSSVGLFAPDSWPYGRRISGVCEIILFIIIGLRVFRVAL